MARRVHPLIPQLQPIGAAGSTDVEFEGIPVEQLQADLNQTDLVLTVLLELGDFEFESTLESDGRWWTPSTPRRGRFFPQSDEWVEAFLYVQHFRPVLFGEATRFQSWVLIGFHDIVWLAEWGDSVFVAGEERHHNPLDGTAYPLARYATASEYWRDYASLARPPQSVGLKPALSAFGYPT